MSLADDPTQTSLSDDAGAADRGERRVRFRFRDASAPSLGHETRELLRVRLRLATRVLALGLIAYAVRDLLVPPATMPWLRAAVIVFFVGAALVLRSDRRLSLAQLRRVEVGLLAVAGLWFAGERFVTLGRLSEAGDALGLLHGLEFMVLVFVLLIAGYAIFAPNTWQRTLKVTGPLAALPVGVVGLLATVDPQSRPLIQSALGGGGASSLVLALVIMVAMAATGARLIHALRQEAFEARQLGHYRLDEKIGEGGMGEVWRGRHMVLPRPAAVKLIRPETVHASSPLHAQTILRAFEREAAATAALRSPHSVEVYDFGITEDQVFFYVMELLDGYDLRQLVHQFGPQPDGRVLRILTQVCDALGEAHAAGMIHRDIKPANVFVGCAGLQPDFVKVLDFGLVARIDPQDESSGLGLARGFVGTPGYMAPEVIRESPRIDARADLYALGCVGYWLLTGRPVFEPAPDAGKMDVLMAHLEAVPEPPSRRLGRSVDPGLERVVMRCLEKRPEVRPGSAAQVQELLASCAAAGAWSRSDARRWWAAHAPGAAPGARPG